MNIEKIKKILIISISGMGTTILFLPLLHLIKKRFPQTEISIFVSSIAVKDILSNNKNVDKIFLWDFFENSKISTIKYLLSLRKENFDISLNVYPNLRKEHNIISFLIGAKLRISHSFEGKNFSKFSFLSNKKIPANLSIHDTENNLNLLKEFGIKESENVEYPNLILPEAEMEFAEKLFKNYNLSKSDLVVGTHVGDNPTTKGRNLPTKNFLRLFNLLIKKNIKIIIFSTPEEIEDVNKIKNVNKDKIIVFQSPEILKVASIISKCNCFVTDDSGLMHVASSVQTPIIALFGPTNKKWTSPRSNCYKIIETGIDCSPCLDRMKRPKGRGKNKLNLNCIV